MAIPFPPEPFRWALESAERDGLRGEEALVRALELAIAEGGPAGQATIVSVREALSGPRRGFEVPEADLTRARQLVSRLDPLTPKERMTKIAQSRGHFRGVAVGEALLERAWSCLPSEGAASGAWALCAIRVINLSDTVDHRVAAHAFSVLARAWALAANSARIACNLGTAEKLIEQAIRTVDMQGLMDLATRAEVMELAARVQRARRQTDSAIENLGWSAAVWEVLGRRAEQLRVLATLAMTLQVAGEPEEALGACRRGLPIATEVGNRRLEWHLKHNEFEILCDLSRIEEAKAAAQEVRQLAAPFSDSFTRIRVEWLEGRLARLEGRQGAAVLHLKRVLDQFLELKSPYDSALVSIDLATLHLEAGRFQEAAELATAMAATFDALGVQREAWAACRLFADACERQRASVALAKNLARYLDQARQDPEYGFPASAVVG